MCPGNFLQQYLDTNLPVLKTFPTQGARAHFVALSEAMNMEGITQNMRRLMEKQ
jgi:hypothetical protein